MPEIGEPLPVLGREIPPIELMPELPEHVELADAGLIPSGCRDRRGLVVEGSVLQYGAHAGADGAGGWALLRLIGHDGQVPGERRDARIVRPLLILAADRRAAWIYEHHGSGGRNNEKRRCDGGNGVWDTISHVRLLYRVWPWPRTFARRGAEVDFYFRFYPWGRGRQP